MNRLKEIRQLNRLTQSDLAGLVNVKQNTISNWENGKTEIDYKSLKTLTKILNCSADYLLGYDEELQFDNDLIRLIKMAQGDRTQNDFAIHCGISSATLTQIKNGEYKTTPETLKKIASHAYNGVTYAQLMKAAGFLDNLENAVNIPPYEEHPQLKNEVLLLAREIQDFDDNKLQTLKKIVAALREQ